MSCSLLTMGITDEPNGAAEEETDCDTASSPAIDGWVSGLRV